MSREGDKKKGPKGIVSFTVYGGVRAKKFLFFSSASHSKFSTAAGAAL